MRICFMWFVLSIIVNNYKQTYKKYPFIYVEYGINFIFKKKVYKKSPGYIMPTVTSQCDLQIIQNYNNLKSNIS